MEIDPSGSIQELLESSTSRSSLDISWGYTLLMIYIGESGQGNPLGGMMQDLAFSVCVLRDYRMEVGILTLSLDTWC